MAQNVAAGNWAQLYALHALEPDTACEREVLILDLGEALGAEPTRSISLTARTV